MKYCRDTRSCAKHILVPLDPQPVDSNVIALTHYTRTLAVDPNYTHRATWLVCTGYRSDNNIAVVKYIGTHVTGAPHGLCKKPVDEQPYVRTSYDTMQQAGIIGHQMPVKAVYNKLINQLDVDDAPRNSAVVRNKKYRDGKDPRTANGTVHCKTIGDEFQTVFNLVQADKEIGHDSFVRYCIATVHRVPSVILYTVN